MKHSSKLQHCKSPRAVSGLLPLPYPLLPTFNIGHTVERNPNSVEVRANTSGVLPFAVLISSDALHSIDIVVHRAALLLR